MKLSKTEFKVLEQIALGGKKVVKLAKTLKKDMSQIYRVVKKLNQKNFVKLKKGEVKPLDLTHVQILLQELATQSNSISLLSGSGIEFYTYLLEPRTLDELIRGTGVKRSTVFYNLKQAKRISFIRVSDNKYQFNKLIWPKVYEFLMELKKYNETNDLRVPPGAVIYYKTKNEIIFSSKFKFDATLTGFSAYDRLGIKIYTIDFTYYLPKKKLTKKEVFIHSLYRIRKEKTIQNLIITILFYIKYKKYLLDVHDEIVDNFKKILKGKKIESYPVLAELKDRAEVYDIKI